jgi:hypothetical protein
MVEEPNQPRFAARHAHIDDGAAVRRRPQGSLA